MHMKRNHFFKGLFLLALLASSCTTEKFDVTDSTGETQNTSDVIVCEGKFNVVLNGYDGVTVGGVSTRGAGDWTEGDKLYLLLTSGSQKITADAMYSGGKWTVNLAGTPVKGTLTECVAYYFEDADKFVGTTLNISDRTAVYEDLNGRYLYDGSTINISAFLEPKFGRVRFAGNKNEILDVFGMTYATTYDASTGVFSYTNAYIVDTVKASGYTPYIYGYMEDPSDARLYVVTKKSAFTKYCDDRVFKVGESGYLTVPTTESHFGWFEYLALKVEGYELKMMPILYETANPKYLMLFSETEVTEGLYNAVMGGGSITNMKPKVSISHSSSCSFAQTSISSITGLSFDLPTKEEWIYAFGSYEFSGSNVVNEVAWYADNSDGMIQPVRQLKPNEYGLYDMSGNVAEWALGYSGSYYYYYPYCGGNYTSVASNCTNNTPTFDNISLNFSPLVWWPYIEQHHQHGKRKVRYQSQVFDQH